MTKQDELDNLAGEDTDVDSQDMSTNEDEDILDADTSEEEDDGEEAEMDLPAAVAALEEAKRHIRKVNRESANRRHEIAALQEKLDQFTKTGDDATKQLEDLQHQLGAAQEQLAVSKLRDAFDEAVAKAKIPFVNQIAQRDTFEFAKAELLKLGEGATEEDFLDIIKEIMHARPYLRIKPKGKDINSTNRGTTDVISGIDMEEIETAFGLKNR